MADISQILKASGIDAERTATQIFGSAVEDFSKRNIEPVIQSVFGGDTTQTNRNDGTWHASSYAHSLANSNFRPKLKFLFKVEFLFKEQVLAQYPELRSNSFTFSIKALDRPKVDFEYEEVNRYNFRTKVLKQIKHRELTITFVDDVGNQVYSFFRIMMMVHSPITRRSVGAGHNIAEQAALYNTGNGMLFTDAIGTKNDFAHRGAIGTDIGNVIQAIKVTQMFVQPFPGSGRLDDAAKEVAYFFVNPRIVYFDLDDMNHESSDANLFTMQFDYDFLVMAPMTNLQPIPAEKALPGIGGAPGEVTSTGRSTGTPAEGGGMTDQISRMIGAIGGRAAQKITSETVGKYVRMVPGLGGAADQLGGLIGGTVSKTISGGIPQIGGMITNLGGGLNGMNIAAPQSQVVGRNVVNDTSTFGVDYGTLTTSTSQGLFMPKIQNPFGE